MANTIGLTKVFTKAFLKMVYVMDEASGEGVRVEQIHMKENTTMIKNVDMVFSFGPPGIRIKDIISRI